MKILQVAAECHGLAKTGGLADMVGSLSAALGHAGEDIRVCLPAYRGAREQLEELKAGETFDLFAQTFQVLQGRLRGTAISIVLLDCPALFDRDGDPYRDGNGIEFPDNGWRFGCFCHAVLHLVREGILDGGSSWEPDLVHLHDWHTGLAAALLDDLTTTVFTVHNFSFHGTFERELFDALGLPDYWWHPEALEFYGRFSFMKAGLQWADKVTTVSPRYAQEMGAPEFGCGLEGVVQQLGGRLQGIVNGIDESVWNPATDAFLSHHYSAESTTSGKQLNKRMVQKKLGLKVQDVPLAIFVGRFADQKGPDLILDAHQDIAEMPLQLVVLGSGDKEIEDAFVNWAEQTPDQVAACIGLDETLAHELTAAADIQLMPSRFEPCGLSQMYAQRYGTLPVARRTGGLADTIVDLTPETLAAGTATGFLFDEARVDHLVAAIQRALVTLQNDGFTRRARQSAMRQNFSWSESARAYQELYRELHALAHTA